jgi:hypothetical protein
LQRAIQQGQAAHTTVDPLANVKAQKYAFVRDLQTLMGGAIIRRTTESKTNEGTLITGLPPKVVTQFIVRLSDAEYGLLNHELHVVGEETKGSLDVMFEVSCVVGLLGRRVDFGPICRTSWSNIGCF